MRRILFAVLKIAISAALLYLALRTTDFTALAARLTIDSLKWLVLAVAALLLQICLLSMRWYLLSGFCDAPLSPRQAFRFTMIGVFFNQTLPSSIGGDAVRLWLLGRKAGWRAATYSIFIDRAIGLMALALLVLICLPWSLTLITDPKVRAVLLTIEAAALGASIGFLTIGVLPARWLDRWQPTHHIRRCAVIARHALFGSRSGVVIWALSLSIHIVSVSIAWCAAAAIASPVSFCQLLLLQPPVSLIILLPISIAGWGLRETALGAGFASAGLSSAEGVYVSLIFGTVSFLFGTLGGLLWIVSAEKAEKGSKPIDVPATIP